MQFPIFKYLTIAFRTFENIKVYADTSAIGGCFDEVFKEWSMALFEEFKTGTKFIMLSDLTMQEIELARQEVREKINEISVDYRIVIGITNEAIDLVETYIIEDVLTNKSYNDALHIALATLNNTDVLASWNFKHIVETWLQNDLNKNGKRNFET